MQQECGIVISMPLYLLTENFLIILLDFPYSSYCTDNDIAHAYFERTMGKRNRDTRSERQLLVCVRAEREDRGCHYKLIVGLNDRMIKIKGKLVTHNANLLKKYMERDDRKNLREKTSVSFVHEDISDDEMISK